MATYRTDYSDHKNIDTLDRGSYGDFGDGTPAKQVLINKLNSFSPSKDVDAITVEYPSGEIEVYKYRQGGIAGSILETVTVTYTAASKKDLLSVVIA